jgi:GNAT superfamily N-acetyltransferase
MGRMATRFEWRGEFSNEALNRLHAEAFEHQVLDHDWLQQVRAHSLGWVCAFEGDNELVGFVNVPWDGGVHAFLMDTAIAERVRRQGIGTTVVAVATERARDAGCEWLHVDFDGTALRRFYVQSCRFTPTTAGLVRLVS